MRNLLNHQDYRQLVALYFRAKEVIIAAEREEGEQRVSLSAVAELRSALDHIMRIHARVLSAEDGGRNPQGADDTDSYIDRHISKAAGHLYRAAYDAYDIIGIQFLDAIQALLSSVSREALYSVIPDAHGRILTPIRSSSRRFTAAKISKDVESREEEANRFAEYEAAVEEYMRIGACLSEHMPALLEFDRERKYTRQRNLALNIAIALSSAILGALLGWALT